MATKVITLATDFTDVPGGRFRSQGEGSGEEFREDVLLPALRACDSVEVDLNGLIGLPPSFLDEAFGSVARKQKELIGKLKIRLNDNKPAVEILRDCVPLNVLI